MMTFDPRRSLYRKTAWACLVALLWQTFAPSTAFALTSGPGQPEFSSFEPVATTQLVNDLSGDFTYNIPVVQIPGLEGGGYAMSLSYHSGVSPEEESSWVGYGWTLNPGAINRQKRSLPDDWQGENVKTWNKTKLNATISLQGHAGDFEIYSKDVPINLSGSLRYNNYRGFGYKFGLGWDFVEGLGSLGFSYEDGKGSFSVQVSPGKYLSREKQNAAQAVVTMEQQGDQSGGVDMDAPMVEEPQEKSFKEKLLGKGKKTALKQLDKQIAKYNFRYLQDMGYPSMATKYNGVSVNASSNIQLELSPFHVGFNGGLRANITLQKNVNETDLPAYGYMYSEFAPGNSMMDYSVEKDDPFEKKDRFLPIPFNGADLYAVTGEALGGGFRMHKRKVAYYHPNDVKSYLGIGNISLEAGYGQKHVEGGQDWGLGFSALKSAGWDNEFLAWSEKDLDNAIFRFSNDMGGHIAATEPSLQRASLTPTGLLADLIATNTLLYSVASLGRKQFRPNPTGIVTTLNDGEDVDLATFIGYNRNSEMVQTHGGVNYKSYSKDPDVEAFLNRTTGVEKQIGEFSMVNPGGQRYTYGLPVYNRNEKRMAYDPKNSTDVFHNHIVYKSVGNDKIKQGTEADAPYASTYLLTSIEDPDYIDRTNDGPTEDDFGGWTRFKYRRLHGSNNKATGPGWYNWRMPYKGYTYSRNSFSDPDDDLVSYTEGEKEVYLLDQIETRTHIAVFVTGPRNDARDALANAGTGPSGPGNAAMEKLERIELYSKGFDGTQTLIQTTHFEYTYELQKGLPNTAGAGAESGKLTLKRVWFEYAGVKPAWVNPYEFEYEYPDAVAADYPTPYDALEDYGAAYAATDENPDYSPFNLDAWGNYQGNGTARFDNYLYWLDQTPTSNFDPAAWQLKVIKLPSGGEIHVQYEQDDYQYVQDQPALSMVSLAGSESEGSVGNNRFYLNHEDIGISSPTELTDLKDLIERQFVNTGERLYFKFLYKLLGYTQAELEDCNVEYIKGYLHVTEVGIASYGGTNRIWLRLGKPGSDFNLPVRVCRDFVKTQRQGKISHQGCSEDNIFGDSPALGVSPSDAYTMMLNFANMLIAFGGPLITCKDIKHSASYLRVPNLHPKRGGGVRVKRLLMFEDGTHTGRKELYGKEYTYEVYDKDRKAYISSGVATNEPMSMREENALVRHMPRFWQTFLEKVVSGRDRKQVEGPLGESLLPGPSVGYAKVVIEDIHASVETGSGFVTKEFLTVRDYPMKDRMTEIRDKKDIALKPGVLVQKKLYNIWMTQGYLFELNNMHGQPLSEKWYAGTYQRFEAQNSSLVQSTEHQYYEPGAAIPIMKGYNEIVTDVPAGREVDLTMEAKQVREETIDGSIEADLGVQLIDVPVVGTVPIPFKSVMPSLSHTKNEIYTHATTKVVTHPTVKKATISYREGIYHREEFLAFSAKTGEPLITQTTDGFQPYDPSGSPLDLLYSTNHDGTYKNYQIPAWTEFETFDQMSKNERDLIESADYNVNIVKASAGKISFTASATTPAGGICDALSNFGPGDLVDIADGNGNLEVAYITGIEGNALLYDNVYYSPIVGNDGAAVTLKVIRSGKNNRISETVGEFTTYGKSTTTDQPTPSSVDGPRQAFVDQLNNHINTGSLQTFYPSGQAAEVEFVFEGLAGECFAMVPEVMGLKFSTNGSTFSINHDINVGGPFHNFIENPCGPVVEDQPIVGADKGHFALDPKTNLLQFFPAGNDCYPISSACLQFCGPYYPGKKVTNVVACKAVVPGDDWSYNLNGFPDWNTLTNRGTYEMGTKGKWRTKSIWSYNDKAVANVPVPYLASNPNKNYSTGTFTMDYFNWLHPEGNGVFWQKDVTINAYGPDGQPVAETNRRGIQSAALFGYNQRLPIMVVSNSDLQSAYYESYECNYGTVAAPVLERDPSQNHYGDYAYHDDDVAHSGTSSVRVNANDINGFAGNTEANLLSLPAITVSEEIKAQGLELLYWIKNVEAIDHTVDFRLKVYPDPISQPVLIDWPGGGDIETVAKVGEWTLCRGMLPASTFSAYTVGLTVMEPSIKIYRPNAASDYLDGGTEVWLDDIVIRPHQSITTCYVYDKPTFRVIASFNESHFGTYYQYNAEGQLIRKIVETERGRKTLQETHYHTPKTYNAP